mgnify:CR=1 FL=1
MTEQPAPAPFKGLMPFGEEDAMFFFGREIEQRIIMANLLAYPLTVLYGATGVGKSSVLRAGVAHQLHQQASRNVAESGKPLLAAAVVNNWRDPPLGTIRQAVEEALADVYPKALRRRDPKNLASALRVWAQRIEGPVLVILDQFEEYFLYQAEEDGPRSFAQVFPRIVNANDIRANILVAIREDAMTWLDRFKSTLPNLFENYLRIRHLDKASATRAITGPIEAHNAPLPPVARVMVEPALIDAVLEGVRFGRATLGTRGQGLAGRETSSEALQGYIETPYLQLVMSRVWDAELDKGSRRLRLATLRNDLGGAGHIVQTHLDTSMQTLPPEEQGIAAGVFQYLVTPSGTKFAHLVSDLSDLTKTGEDELEPVLRKLADARILRQVPPAANQADAHCYEIFHDVLARAILDWRSRYVQEQDQQRARAELAQQLREKQEEAERERREREREEQQRRLALSNGLAAMAMTQLSVDPELSVLLAVEALNQSKTPLAQDALRQSLLECRIRSVLLGHEGDVSWAAFSPDGTRIVTASQDTTARLWMAATGEPIAVLRGHTNWVWRAEFSPDGETVLTASLDDTARVWDSGTNESGRPLSAPGASGCGNGIFSRDGKTPVRWRERRTNTLGTAYLHVAALELPGFYKLAVYASKGSRRGLVTKTFKVRRR